jgi:hypothetical protein
MSHTLWLAVVFLASATFGYTYVLRTNKMQAGIAKICGSYVLAGFLVRKWLHASAYCVLTLRLMGVLGWVLAAIAYFALISRLVNSTKKSQVALRSWNV